MTDFNAIHPRGNPENKGQFVEAGRNDPGTTVLDAPQPQPIFTSDEIEHIRKHGPKMDGQATPDDVDRLAGGIRSVELAAVWSGDEIDEWAGEREWVGRVGDGPWRTVSEDGWDLLVCGTNTGTFLDDQQYAPVFPHDAMTHDGHNFTIGERWRCGVCFAPISDFNEDGPKLCDNHTRGSYSARTY